jgi:hypothetical protein
MDGRWRAVNTRVVTDPLAPAAPATLAAAGTEPSWSPRAPVAAIDPAAAELLEATADAFVESLADLDVPGAALAGKAGAITGMGDRELREVAAVSSRALDRAAIDQQMVAQRVTMTRLQQYALLAACLDRALEARIPGPEASDPDRARVLRHLQRQARRRRQDLLTGVAVAAKGYQALELVRGGADHAIAATVDALRRAAGRLAVDDGGVASIGAGELALPAALPPAGVLPASVSGGD